MRVRAVIAAILLTASLGSPRSSGASVEVIRIGELALIPIPAGAQAQAFDINDNGIVVGTWWPSGSLARVFTYDSRDDVFTDLGTFGGGEAEGLAINDADVVVGSVWLSTATHAFAYDTGRATFTDLGGLGGTFARAWDINDEGVVVGEARTPDEATHAFMAQVGVSPLAEMTALPPPTTATAVNENGLVVGYSGPRAFAYDTRTGSVTTIGTLGGSSSGAFGVNDAGVVVGVSLIEGDVANHAFAYDLATAEMTQIGTLGLSPAQAMDVDNRGLVVGWSHRPHDPGSGLLYDLATGSKTGIPVEAGATSINAVNESGVIVGDVQTADGFRAFVTQVSVLSTPPVGVFVQAGCDGNELTWGEPMTPGDSPVEGYVILRDDEEVARVDAPVTVYVDPAIEEPHTYAVITETEAGDSLPSDEVTAAPPSNCGPPPPAAEPQPVVPAFTG